MERFGGDEAEAATAEFVQPDTQARIRARALIHHYAFKSQRDFRLRIERGVMGDFDQQAIWAAHAEDGGPEVLADLNQIEDTYLADYWRRALAAVEATVVVPRAGGSNVAMGKPALQSSIGDQSRGASVEQDAAGAVSGRITGDFQFHTGVEDAPWWRVDLLAPHRLTEIRLFNSVAEPSDRLHLGRFVIEGSMDGDAWRAIYLHDGSVVGGADGHPLMLRQADSGSEVAVCRYLRITALQPTALHLDQVEIYGEPLRTVPDRPVAADIREPRVLAALDDLIALLGNQLGAPSR
jgi:hypothetical protein